MGNGNGCDRRTLGMASLWWWLVVCGAWSVYLALRLKGAM